MSSEKSSNHDLTIECTSGVFAGDPQCFDKSDEHNQLCGCEDYEWPCQDGDGCIPLYSVCDGTPHCHDYSDEFAQVYISLAWLGSAWGF